MYFRRLGPEAAIHDKDEQNAKGGELVKPGIERGYGEFRSLTHHPDFLARRDTQETLKAAVIELMDKYRLDALVHPFKSLPPERHLDENVREKDNPLSSVTGLPALLVPAGYTRVENGPIALEILGRPFAEPTLFKLAYAYEQVSHARKPAPTTPPLPGERFEY
jgi:Asp-tRNA(Asn)/Glu-tRNA(Gln) amidotransferase A subunit family amidase